MNEQTIVQKIKQHLNFGTEHLGRETLTRLQKARAGALSRFEARQTAHGFAWAGHGTGRLGHAPHLDARFWLPVAILVLGLFAVTYWQQRDNGDAGEIDIAILADDLPVNAYIDKRFEAWLKRSQE